MRSHSTHTFTQVTGVTDAVCAQNEERRKVRQSRAKHALVKTDVTPPCVLAFSDSAERLERLRVSMGWVAVVVTVRVAKEMVKGDS